MATFNDTQYDPEPEGLTGKRKVAASDQERGFDFSGSSFFNRMQDPAYDPTHLDPDWARENPDKAQARLTRAQWDYAKKVYQPAEDAAIAEVTDSVDDNANRAGGMVASAFERGRGTAERNRSRYGVSTSARNQNVLDRRSKFTESKSTAGAENRTRRGLTDRNTNAMGVLAGHSQGIASGATDALDSAAGMKAQRDAAGKQMDAQQKSNQLGGAAAGAAIGTQILPGLGTAAGAAVGFFLG